MDLWDRMTKRDQALPPRWLRFDSQSDFEEIGLHLKKLCTEYGGLTPGCSVLDIGCGVGRLAAPLTHFLDSNSRYEGFDVDKQAIAWCQRAIGSRHRNFNFRLTSVNNEHYNPDGEERGENFQFPYEKNAFDFAVATSVFTHLSTEDAKQYLRELSRVLKPGASAVLTWYVLEDAQGTENQGQDLSFDTPIDAFSATATPKNPLAAMAFRPDFILETIADVDLIPIADIYPGTWRVDEGPTHQDLLIVHKPTS
ncbi:class I SAM-dependent methyltransferase [Congregibacter brevis]|uniref:Class I SAM-dependent methyltransferase n=1 Tax=Congregibacter brevis TaxID=3081201 RepID=A0ABZ0IFU1_9GAMM|nr:class I SAM-dependent methyltransferase [Congregibacter sp. IMCC45268]